jgi:hypothetical protein
MVQDAIRPIKLDKATANYPKAKEYQRMNIAGMELSSIKEESSESEDSDSRSEDQESSDISDSAEESEEECMEDSEKKHQQVEESGNRWDSPPDSGSD